MAIVSSERMIVGSVADAEARWFDTSGWPAWIDGCDRVAELRGPWPRAGGAVSWESGPAGRGSVTETVIEQAPGSGQTVDVTDDSIEGRQTVTFDAEPDGVRVTLTLSYRIRRRSPLTPVIDRLFVRRAMTQSLDRTLDRFGARAARADAEAAGAQH